MTGDRDERARCWDYIRWLLKQQKGTLGTDISFKDRNDVTVFPCKSGFGGISRIYGTGGATLRLSAAASYAGGRVDFAFDEAYFDVAGVRLPYPVPFRLLGDEARGYLDTRYVSDRLRVSTGNKGTTFVLRRKPSPPRE